MVRPWCFHCRRALVWSLVGEWRSCMLYGRRVHSVPTLAACNHLQAPPSLPTQRLSTPRPSGGFMEASWYQLEKEMATHSSILAWRIPGTGEPGGLPSVGSHRVGHNWSGLAAAAAWYQHKLSNHWPLEMDSTPLQRSRGLGWRHPPSHHKVGSPRNQPPSWVYPGDFQNSLR